MVSIKEFERFLKRSGYQERRHKENDRWDSVNKDNPELPACVTWFDANAYCAWYQKKYNFPIRLLSVDEYKTIYPLEAKKPLEYLENFRDPNPKDEKTMSNLSKLNYLPLLWNYPDGRLFDNKHLEEEEWQAIEVRWPEKLNWQKASSGLMFLTHPEFGEWMSENKYSMSAAIDTLTLNPLPWLHEMDFAPETYFSARSCGKYRYCKIGFRICYSD